MKLNSLTVLTATTIACACCLLCACQSDPVVDGTRDESNREKSGIDRADTPDGAIGDPAAIDPMGVDDEDQDPNIG